MSARDIIKPGAKVRLPTWDDGMFAIVEAVYADHFIWLGDSGCPIVRNISEIWELFVEPAVRWMTIPLSGAEDDFHSEEAARKRQVGRGGALIRLDFTNETAEWITP